MTFFEKHGEKLASVTLVLGIVALIKYLNVVGFLITLSMDAGGLALSWLTH